MAAVLKVTGMIITCMDKVCILGKMGAVMMAIMKRIRSMAMVFTTGLMGVYTKANGATENNMVKVYIHQLMAPLEKASGKMVEELNG